MQGVTIEGGFVLHLTSLIHSSTQKCKNLSISRKKRWPQGGHGRLAAHGRIRPRWPHTATTGNTGLGLVGACCFCCNDSIVYSHSLPVLRLYSTVSGLVLTSTLFVPSPNIAPMNLSCTCVQSAALDGHCVAFRRPHIKGVHVQPSCAADEGVLQLRLHGSRYAEGTARSQLMQTLQATPGCLMWGTRGASGAAPAVHAQPLQAD
jgi:hypothetical protein